MQRASQFCLVLTLPLFLAYLSMAKPDTRSKAQARSHLGTAAVEGRQTFCAYRVNTGNWEAVRPPGKKKI